MIDRFDGDHAFLSNFHPSEVEYDGLTYATVEHAYQAAKTLNFAERVNVRACRTPGCAKRMGTKVTLREDWRSVNMGIMKDLLRQKFSDPSLQKKLLATGKQELVEGNNWGDVFWGKVDGVGENHLGILLMQVREEAWQANHAL